MTIEQYLSNINSQYQLGNATEHTYRGALCQLIESILPDVRATNEPKRQSCGAPDYILTKNDIPVGFIEAKDIGDTDLKGKKKNKEQFDRYKASLGNLIFTDYINFYFYQNGELVTQIEIAKVIFENNIGVSQNITSLRKSLNEKGGKIVTIPQNFATFENLIKNFCLQKTQTIKSPKKLAEMMAAKAKLLADVIEKSLTSDQENSQNSSLKDQMQGFKDILIHDITEQGFADVYAQTICYGMFAARMHDSTLPTFSRQEAAELIPKSNPFLRKLFGYIAGPDIDDRILWIVDSLVEIFLACDVRTILADYGKSTGMEDPIIHFYETFLSEYDPKLRKARGVWYTPKPVVNFIVRAVDEILKTHFQLPQGLADTSTTRIKRIAPHNGKTIEEEIHKVQILDPATGTGTFLAEAVKLIHQKFQGQQGIWSKYVNDHLIPRLNGFELLIASYAMAHLKLDLLLTETGYKSTTNQRLRIYLTNSLEESHPDTGTLFASWLSSEANEANFIKRETPVMCVMGNPPYSVSSNNKSPWIEKLIGDYKKNLNERNIQPLSDDYIKFIKLGQHFIDKNGSGILAYISNNSFLDGIIHRQMRKNLLETFDEIYILDLHGNAKKKEVCADGSADQNVFDIMQGVSINIFVKKKQIPPSLRDTSLIPQSAELSAPLTGSIPPSLRDTSLKGGMANGGITPPEGSKRSFGGIEKSEHSSGGIKYGWDQIHYLPINKKLVERSKEMSKNMTKPEQLVWFNVLKSDKTGYKWRKQQIIDNYIVDFYCYELGLVIEIDGDSHDDRQEYDKVRTNLLQLFDLEVIRYTNAEICDHLEGVMKDLELKINERVKFLTLSIPPKLRFDPSGGVIPRSNLPPFKEVSRSDGGIGDTELARVNHYNLQGKRDYKYQFLTENSLKSIEWTELDYSEPNYFFVPKDFGESEEYKKGFKIDELFRTFGPGVETGYDELFVSESRSSLITKFSKIKDKLDEVFNYYKIVNKPSFSLKNKLLNDDLSEFESKIQKYQYRPFDYRNILYLKNSLRRADFEVFKNENNIFLTLMKKAVDTDSFKSVLISNSIIDKNLYGFQTYAFPLYIYANPTEQNSLDEDSLCRPNLNPDIVAQIEESLGMRLDWDADITKSYLVLIPPIPPSLRDTSLIPQSAELPAPLAGQGRFDGGITPLEGSKRSFGGITEGSNSLEFGGIVDGSKQSDGGILSDREVDWNAYFTPTDLLDYIYAVLHSPSYREKYKEFLKIDFPRVPLPVDSDQFWKFVKLGGELRQIHLLESPVLENYTTQYPVDGDNIVEKVKFEIKDKQQSTSPTLSVLLKEENEGRVYINDTQYFGNVPEVAWNFYIGGYQPAQKWLKDRKSRTLEFDDILHYQKIIVALAETARIMNKIDSID
jgi:very-short-patch-repair endonuclease